MKDVTLRSLILPALCVLGATALSAQENNTLQEKEHVIILRNNDLKPHPGKENVTFYRLSQTDEVQRVILGIYPGEKGEGPGLSVSELVNGGGAAEAGILAGDRILEVDSKQISDAEDLRYALSTHKAGDDVRVLYLRGDQSYYAVVNLTSPRQAHDYKWSWREERDPCRVFIGVYTHTWKEGPGVKVDGVIGGTSAEVAGLKENDVILALDDVTVGTHEELVRERDKHKAGDFYTLTIRRGELTFDVDAQFKECPTNTKETVATTPEPVIEEPVIPAQQQPALNNAEPLQLEQWKAFPNPTYGQINVRFQAEPTPTGLQVTDSYGRVVYREQLNNFDGNFDRQLNLGGATPGIYTLSVTQGDKVFTEKIVLLPKA